MYIASCDALQCYARTRNTNSQAGENTMTHDIFRDITGRDCMFVVGQREDAWHKLGQRCDSAVSWEQAMELAGLDWQVVKNQNYARNPHGKVVPVSSYSIFRDIDGAELAS